MVEVILSICSLMYILIFIVVYFGKKRIELEENKVYSMLLITTACGLAIDIAGFFSFKLLEPENIINLTIAKLYLIYYFTWGYIITIYTNIISFQKTIKHLTHQIFLLFLSICGIVLLLPIHFQTTEYSMYSYGPSVNFVYIISTVFISIMLACLAIKRKSIKQRKYIPLLALVIAGSIVVLIQKIWPELLLITFAESIVTTIMYFTIENPDLQMVEELSINKKLTEQNFEEKTNFIFKISQELKQPLQDISKISKNIYETTSGETKEQAKIINYNSKQLYKYVNNALDISSMDIKNLKIVEGIYNTKNFFEEIRLRIKNELKKQNKNLELRYNISNNIPEYLSGDNTKLKQVITSVIMNSIKYTEKGFIELSVDSIVRYGMCRLLIEISDSGRGIELEKINEILSVSKEITNEEVEKIDKLHITLPLAHKIIKALNGSFLIKSETNKGTNVLIAIDQKIEDKQKIKKQSLENYSKRIVNDKKILMITNDKKIIRDTKSLLENFDIVTSPFAKDCLEKIQNEKFECIVIDEDLNEESGINIIKEIKKIKNDLPSLILINKKNEFLGKHYIEDGFEIFLLKKHMKKK